MPQHEVNAFQNRLTVVGIKTYTETRDPTSSDTAFRIPTLWINTASNAGFLLVTVEGGAAVWLEVGYVAGPLSAKDFYAADTAPPGAPSAGDTYILDESLPVDAGWTAVGATNDDIVEYGATGWVVYTPNQGRIIYDDAAADFYIYDGTTWGLLSSSISSVTYTSAARSPRTTDNTFVVPTIWTDTVTKGSYILSDVTGGVATWTKIGDNHLGDAQDSVLGRVDGNNAPPTEVEDDRYIIYDGGGGVVHANWDGASFNDICTFDGATWVAFTPSEGTYTEVENEDTIYMFTTSWVKLFQYTGAAFGTDSGTANPDSTGTLNIVGTAAQGITSAGAGNTVTFTIADATTSQKGVGEVSTNAEAVAVTAVDKFLVPGNMTALFAEPPAYGGTTPAAVTATTVTSPLFVVNTNTGNTQTHFSVTPNTVIAASQVWKGFYIAGTALDPSGASAEIYGYDLDFSGVSLANDPAIYGHRVQMPATYSGEAEKAAYYGTGWGFIFEALSGDHNAAWRTLGPLLADYDGTGLAAGIEETILNAVVQTAGSTGGELHAVDVAVGGSGSAAVWAIGTHPGVGVIHQHIGTPAAPDYAWVVTSGPAYTDRTAEFGSAASDVQIFVADNDEIMVGSSAVFSEIEVILQTVASQSVIPEFYYSIAGPGWTQFYPADDTEGFTQNGSIRFDSGDLSGWASAAVNGQTYYWIRIVRTRNNIVTPPTEDTIKTVATTTYYWDSNADVVVRDITMRNLELTGTFGIPDSDASNHLLLEWNENDSADRTLNFQVNSGNRTINMSGDLTLTGSLTVESVSVLNQDLTTDANVTFAQVAATTFDTNVAAAGLTITATQITTDGTDANIPLVLSGKGTGPVQCNMIGIGTATCPHGGVGIGLVAIEGTDSSYVAGPNIQVTTSADDYPIMQWNTYSHDVIRWYLDGYIDSAGTERSSDAGSNFLMVKSSDALKWYVDSGVAAGNASSYSEVHRITSAGVFNVTSSLFGVGTDTVPHGGVGAAMIAVDGPNASGTGPHMQFTTASDDYPLMQIYNYAHDEMAIMFDCYWNGTTNKSSDAGSNFRWRKKSDAMKLDGEEGIAAGNTATFVNYWNCDQYGHITKPLQSAFMATVSSGVNNVTGNGTTYTLIYGSEIYDQNADYNNATGVYTAPVTARMLFTAGVEMLNCGGMTSGYYVLVTSNRNYTGFSSGDITNSANNYVATFARYSDMDAADTAHTTISINGLGGDTADVNGNASAAVTSFGGAIIC